MRPPTTSTAAVVGDRPDMAATRVGRRAGTLFDGGTAHLVGGIIDQVATVVVATALAVLVLLRRDPAA